MTKKCSRKTARYDIWGALYATLENDLYGNGSEYIYGCDDDPDDHPDRDPGLVQLRVEEAEKILEFLKRKAGR